jgi:hypothetical protein
MATRTSKQEPALELLEYRTPLARLIVAGAVAGFLGTANSRFDSISAAIIGAVVGFLFLCFYLFCFRNRLNAWARRLSLEAEKARLERVRRLVDTQKANSLLQLLLATVIVLVAWLLIPPPPYSFFSWRFAIALVLIVSAHAYLETSRGVANRIGALLLLPLAFIGSLCLTPDTPVFKQGVLPSTWCVILIFLALYLIIEVYRLVADLRMAREGIGASE